MSKILTLIFTGFLCSLSVQAQINQEIADSLEFEEVIVTATKIPISLRETTKPVLVIDQETISRSSGKDVAQLLSEQSGIYINGAFSNTGKDKATYLQGASTKYTLFLIDGLPVNDPSTIGGVFDIRNLALDTIERIEIVKGSMSTLYGSDAIAGVINIITKKAGPNTVNANATASFGSYGAKKGQIGLSGRERRGSFSINFTRENFDGISEAIDSLGTGSFDKDGFEKNTFSAKVSIMPIQGLTVTPKLLLNTFDGDYDAGIFADAPNTFETEFFNPGITVNYENEAFSLTTNYSYTNTNRKNIAAFGGEFEGKLQNFDTYGSYAFNPLFNLLVGFSYQNMLLGSESPSSDLYSPYATAVVRDWNGFNSETGIRLNRHNEYGTNVSVSQSFSYILLERFKLFGSISTGFKAPTLDELYGLFGANPDLKPEESLYMNFGTEYYIKSLDLKFSANIFSREIENVLFYGTTGYINQDNQKDSGFEFTSRWLASRKLTVFGTLDLVDGEITSKDFSGNSVTNDNLFRRPKVSIGGGITVMPIENLNLSLNLNYFGEREDVYFTPSFARRQITLDPYLLINAYADYSILENKATIFIDLKNLLDKDFQETYGYNTLGFAINTGIRIQL